MTALHSATARSWESSRWTQTLGSAACFASPSQECVYGWQPVKRLRFCCFSFQLRRPADHRCWTEAAALVLLRPELPVPHAALHTCLFPLRLSTRLRELPAGLLCHEHPLSQGWTRVHQHGWIFWLVSWLEMRRMQSDFSSQNKILVFKNILIHTFYSFNVFSLFSLQLTL